MQSFTIERRLRGSSLALRAALSGFLLFVAIGSVTNLALLGWKTHLSPVGIARYYRGYEPPAGSLEEIRYPKEVHELIENTHFHVYMVPMVLLVLTHVFFMGPWSEGTKVGATVLVYAAALVDLAGPWLVRFVAPGMAWVKLGASLLFHGTLLALVGACLWEAWFAALPACPSRGGGGPSKRQPG